VVPALVRAEPATDRKRDEGHRTVLLVDDEPTITSSLHELLERELDDDVRVLEASSGPDALDILLRERVDLLVTDYKMPGMNGVELMRAAGQNDPLLRVILMTAFESEANQLLPPGLRLDGFFPKPLDIERFVERTETLLDRNRP
jgi:CheY-like chemotaxis protein